MDDFEVQKNAIILCAKYMLPPLGVKTDMRSKCIDGKFVYETMGSSLYLGCKWSPRVHVSGQDWFHDKPFLWTYAMCSEIFDKGADSDWIGLDWIAS